MDGNGPDQAALLIALLRASGYKARFVFGSILADTELDVRPVLDAKRAAMAAHRSQIPETSSARL